MMTASSKNSLSSSLWDGPYGALSLSRSTPSPWCVQCIIPQMLASVVSPRRPASVRSISFTRHRSIRNQADVQSDGIIAFSFVARGVGNKTLHAIRDSTNLAIPCVILDIISGCKLQSLWRLCDCSCHDREEYCDKV